MTYGMSLPENLGGLPSGGARFSVPQQYFPSADDAESVSQYLSTQEQLAATYHQQQRSPLDRRIDTSTMASFNPAGSLGNMQQAAQQNMTNLEEAYNQYRQGLITVFGYTQRGHLNEGSRLLLDLSAWLIDNARDLGKILSFLLFRRLQALRQSVILQVYFETIPIRSRNIDNCGTSSIFAGYRYAKSRKILQNHYYATAVIAVDIHYNHYPRQC